MTVAKVAEISASSKNSFEHAINEGLERANKTLENIEGAWIKDMKVTVRNGKVEDYRVNLKLTFVLQ